MVSCITALSGFFPNCPYTSFHIISSLVASRLLKWSYWLSHWLTVGHRLMWVSNQRSVVL